MAVQTWICRLREMPGGDSENTVCLALVLHWLLSSVATRFYLQSYSTTFSKVHDQLIERLRVYAFFRDNRAATVLTTLKWLQKATVLNAAEFCKTSFVYSNRGECMAQVDNDSKYFKIVRLSR